DDDSTDEWVSKTRKKKEMQFRQELGEKLLKLKPAQLAELNLPEQLLRAFEESARIKKNEALRRHKQYIGRLMRDLDIDPIVNYLEKLETSHHINTRAFHQLEQLRDSLITGGNDEIGEAIETFPQVDRQKLRQLVRNAKNEKKNNAAHHNNESKHSRVLFRFLRELQEQD
ncbi:MAG: DUF615 domain-containing protein, partial [Pseudomonadales bacterium]|nr:DUF615 domain-containing protein [Pseudomonadales bacterium]